MRWTGDRNHAIESQTPWIAYWRRPDGPNRGPRQSAVYATSGNRSWPIHNGSMLQQEGDES
jgi:hypothetical protein